MSSTTPGIGRYPVSYSPVSASFQLIKSDTSLGPLGLDYSGKRRYEQAPYCVDHSACLGDSLKGVVQPMITLMLDSGTALHTVSWRYLHVEANRLAGTTPMDIMIRK